MGVEIRANVRSRASPQTPSADVRMASRRDGHRDWQQSILAVAGGRRRRGGLDLLVFQRCGDEPAALLRRGNGGAGTIDRYEQGLRKNNRARIRANPCGRERKMQRFKSPGSPSAFFPFTPPSTKHSTSNVISLLVTPSPPPGGSVPNTGRRQPQPESQLSCLAFAPPITSLRDSTPQRNSRRP